LAQKVQDRSNFTKALLKIVRVKTGNLMGEKTEALIVEDSEDVLCLMLAGILSCSDDDNPPQPVLAGCEILCDGLDCPYSCDDMVSSESGN